MRPFNAILLATTFAASFALAGPAAATSAPQAPGSEVMFNPQPEPPIDPFAPQAKGRLALPGSTRMFNPQPEPPAPKLTPIRPKARRR